jgi:5-methylcytosine-specific restriction endonuclease McrA
MARLRSEAYHRSNGLCECGREICLTRPTQERIVTFFNGQLHHLISRAHGGSDEIANVRFISRKCHEEIHGIPLWGHKRNAK